MKNLKIAVRLGLGFGIVVALLLVRVIPHKRPAGRESGQRAPKSDNFSFSTKGEPDEAHFTRF
ncbi:MAG TPA: hypothetical protein DCW29_23890 [Janthinobacterium sp.]|nr:hypothetical protein [Janthinobacterium sp.]